MNVFISHSQVDIDLARTVSTALLREHVKVWWDTIKLNAGDELSPAIFEAIDRADVFVVLVSEASAASRWVQRELAYALSRETLCQLVILPLRLDSAGALPGLEDRIWIDVDASDPGPGVDTLVSRVKARSIPLARTGRSTVAGAVTFTDHAVEARRDGDRLVVLVDVVSVDLDEQYSILSRFEFESVRGFRADSSDDLQAERLIGAMADDYELRPGRVLLGSGDVLRFENEVDDGGVVFVMRGRVRRLGRPSRGVVLFDVGVLFSILDGRDPS